jgi:nitrite reductase (NADH) large subunit
MMQQLVDSYRCEWTEVVNDPERRKLFRQFVNTDETEVGIEIVTERGQSRPADWLKDGVKVQQIEERAERVQGSGFGVQEMIAGRGQEQGSNGRSRSGQALPQWVKVGAVADFPQDGGAAIKYGDVQIAVFNFTSRGEWYACQNMCPHKKAFVLSRGIVGTQGTVPKVACPLHKKTYSLETGECTSGEAYSVKVFPVKISGGDVYLLLPPKSQLDAILGTQLHCVSKCSVRSASA